MKPPPDNLEKELRELLPASPGNAFRRNLEEAMADAGLTPGSAPQNKVIWWRRAIAPMAAAAGLSLAAGLAFWTTGQEEVTNANGTLANATALPATNSTKAAPLDPIAAEETYPVAPGTGTLANNPDYEPVSARNTLNGILEDGIVYLRDGLPAKRYRYQFIDTITFRNARDGSSIEVTVPREEVILVPVQLF